MSPRSVSALLAALVVAGCAAPIGGQPANDASVSVQGTTIERGATGTVTVTAHRVTAMSFDVPGGMVSPDIAVDFENATVRPAPDTIWTSYPPSWSWDARRERVTAEIPVRVAATARPGTYRVEVTVSTGGSPVEEGNLTDAGTITVPTT